jgi:hypothetical protein
VPQPQPQREPADEASPETVNIFNGTKSQSDPALGHTETDTMQKDELKNSMSTPNIAVQVTSEPSSSELTTPRKRDKDKDKDKKRDKDKDKSRSKTDSPKEPRVKSPKDKTRRPKRRDSDDPAASTSGTNTNATTTPVKSKDRRDPETPKSTRNHKRSSTDLVSEIFLKKENSCFLLYRDAAILRRVCCRCMISMRLTIVQRRKRVGNAENQQRTFWTVKAR